jgi:hypothetical protein
MPPKRGSGRGKVKASPKRGSYRSTKTTSSSSSRATPTPPSTNSNGHQQGKNSEIMSVIVAERSSMIKYDIGSATSASPLHHNEDRHIIIRDVSEITIEPITDTTTPPSSSPTPSSVATTTSVGGTETKVHRTRSQTKNDAPSTSYIAVFDGHGGAHAAQFANTNIHQHLMQSPHFGRLGGLPRTLTYVFPYCTRSAQYQRYVLTLLISMPFEIIVKHIMILINDFVHYHEVRKLIVVHVHYQQ